MKWSIVFKYAFGVLGGLLVAWGLYAGLIRPTTKPNPTTSQEGNITNYYNQPRISFGCASFKVMETQREK